MQERFERSIVPILRITAGGGRELAGNGIAISRTAVLTCRHVAEESESVLCGKQLCRATAVHKVKDADLACLYFDELPGVAPAQLFRASTLAGLTLHAAGFQQDSDLRLHHVSRLQVILEQRSRGAVQDVQFRGGVSRGLSGAPVFARAGSEVFIVGILWLGRQEAATSRMLPADAILSFLNRKADFRDLPVAELPASAYRGLRIPARRWQADRHGPAAMLVADFEIVPFRGRKSELSGILEWAHDPRSLGIRVYWACGGAGKTRMAIEACKRLCRENFRAGFLASQTGPEELRAIFAAAEESQASGLVIIIDYAESEYVGIRNVIAALSEFPQTRLRLLLLARGTGDWWEMAKQEGQDVGELLTGPATEEPIALEPIGLSKRARGSEFLRAVSAFAQALGKPAPDCSRIDLSAPVFERALLLHTYALFSVLNMPFRKKDWKISAPFLEALWNREKRFIKGLLRSRGMKPLLCRAAEITIAAITGIQGAADADDAISVIRALPLLKDLDTWTIHALAHLLHDAYGGARWIDPLQPDILGEYVFIRVLGQFPSDANAVLTR